MIVVVGLPTRNYDLQLRSNLTIKQLQQSQQFYKITYFIKSIIFAKDECHYNTHPFYFG